MVLRRIVLSSLTGLCLALPLSGVAQAKSCELKIEGSDAMQFNVKELTVEKGCTDVKVTLKHTGKLPKASMGHNWVLAAEADMQALLSKGMQAGAAQDYIPKDPAVVAATKLVGGGESSSASFKTAALKAGTTYKFFCTFPGHSGLMNGTLTVK